MAEMHSLPRRYWPGVAGCRPLLAAGPRVLYINASQHSACLFCGRGGSEPFFVPEMSHGA